MAGIDGGGSVYDRILAFADDIDIETRRHSGNTFLMELMKVREIRAYQ